MYDATMSPHSDLQREVSRFVREFGLHQPGRTACGQPISTSEAHALGLIAEGDQIRMTDLAQQLLLEKSTVSRLVRALEKRDWVTISTDPRDARARLIALTASGKRAAERLAAARSAHFDAVFTQIDPNKRNEVLAALAELAGAARRSREGGPDVASA